MDQVRIPAQYRSRLTLPLIVAPMTGVSSIDLVVAACRVGVIGSFPVHLSSSVDALRDDLDRLADELDPGCAPFAPNLVVHPSNQQLPDELSALMDHHIEMVIASVGAPDAIIEPCREAGIRVLSDVASIRHAHRAAKAGVDGLILLSAGAGGQTGWANPFAFVRAVRQFFDGTIVLAGGIADGVALRAARTLGADLGYMGTRFIAAAESAAPVDYRQAVVDASMDDVVRSDVVGGIPASLLRAWLTTHKSAGPTTDGFDHRRLKTNSGAWSAGHAVGQVESVETVATLVERIADEYFDDSNDGEGGIDRCSLT